MLPALNDDNDGLQGAVRGEGSYGVVVEGVDAEGRLVAVKMLHRETVAMAALVGGCWDQAQQGQGQGSRGRPPAGAQQPQRDLVVQQYPDVHHLHMAQRVWQSFEVEAQLMAQLGGHDNVVTMYGACLQVCVYVCVLCNCVAIVYMQCVSCVCVILLSMPSVFDKTHHLHPCIASLCYRHCSLYVWT